MTQNTDQIQAVVILGAAMDAEGRPGPALLRRVARGSRLAQAKPWLPVIVSGGALTSPVTEASVMRDILLSDGIRADRILCEDRSLNTLENLANTQKMMASNGIASILLVTDNFHMPRALMTCRALGIKARAHPVWNPTAELWAWAIAHMREVVALPVYVYRLGRYRLKAARR